MKTSSRYPHRHFSFFKRAIIGVVGFILSPLSWWNDLFVNFPLAYGFAWGVGKCLGLFIVIRTWLFVHLFIAGYFLTNLLGFLMMHYSIFGLNKEQKGSIRKQLLVSLLYSLAVAAFFGLDICRPEEGCKILPSWVEP
jgi:hypothetical protein